MQLLVLCSSPSVKFCLGLSMDKYDLGGLVKMKAGMKASLP